MRSQISKVKLMDEVEVDNTTLYTDSIRFSPCTGTAAVLIVSSAGQITVTQQCSNNNADWYSPKDTAGDPLCVVATTLTVTTGIYISYTPALAKFVRFSVLEDGTAATNVSLTLLFKSEV
jgi:hypothetical protein